MSVKIEIYGEDAGHALLELRGLSVGLLPPTGNDRYVLTPAGEAALREAAQSEPPVDNAHVAPGATPFTAAAEVAANAPKRERGKPAPGRARRTKEEIAEDEAAEGAAPQISANPENRIDPAQADDSAETQAQDKADEKAEVDANRAPEKPLTRDDVKDAMTAYVATYGLPSTQEDGPKIFGEALGAAPAGEAHWKLSLIPDDQAIFAKVVETWRRAVAANTFKRDKVS